MPTTTVAVPALNRGPGIIWRAPLGTAAFGLTAAGGVFTDLISATSGWVAVGATGDGLEVSYDIDTEDINAAEFLDPLAVAETARNVELSFGLLSFTKSTLLASYNAGSSAATTAGSGGTLVTTITPPAIDASVNCMIGFESQDSTYRALYYNCRNNPNGARNFKKGGAKTVVPFSYRALADATLGIPFKEFFAGATRGA
jgi:hypothetical protein